MGEILDAFVPEEPALVGCARIVAPALDHLADERGSIDHLHQLADALGLRDELWVDTICQACPFHFNTVLATPSRSMGSPDFRTIRYV